MTVKIPRVNGAAIDAKPKRRERAIDRKGKNEGSGQEDSGDKEMRRIALRYSAIGLEMGAAVVIGYAAGWWLDKTFGTKPYLTLVMLLLGIGAAFMAIYRAAREIQKMDHDAGDDE